MVPKPPSILQSTLNAAWAIYGRSETVDDFFEGLLSSLAQLTASDYILLYLEDDTVINDITFQTGVHDCSPQYTSYFVLASSFYRAKRLSPLQSVPAKDLKLRKQTKISNSVYFQTILPSAIGLKNGKNGASARLLAFDSPKITLCRALLIVHIPNVHIDLQATTTIVGQFLDFIVPAIEAVYRRQIDRLSRIIISSGERIYTGNPGYFFQQNFRTICETLKIEGASLIVKGLPSARSSLQLISTYPKELPKYRDVYPEGIFSPTQWIFNFNKSCVIPSILHMRTQLSALPPSSSLSAPIWCDINNISKERCIVYNFYKGQDDIQYCFRCTNSKKTASNLFTILDRKIGQGLVVSLALTHRSFENEYRAMRIFVDVKHEFRQKLIGINSAASYVLTSLRKQPHNDIVTHERFMKLTHIKNTVTEIVKMLSRFNFPSPSLYEEEKEIIPFKPYADLVKPVCETFVEQARKKRMYFTYNKIDQLGLVYSNLSDWTQIIENIVNNMVKYTLENEEMAVAFQRVQGGGGIIHFASKSISIREEERDQIFEFRYRGKAAIKTTEEGDGIGLSIARFIVSAYGGQILLKTQNDINIFSVTLPRHLFRPRDNP